MNNMTNEVGRKIAFLVVALVAVICVFNMPGLAQGDPQQGPGPVRKFFVSGPGGTSGAAIAMPGMPAPGGAVGDVTYQFISSEMSFDGNVVKGAPFSAEATNETTQVLADGNRITHKNTANLYRDAEGRTRREQTLEAIGPWTASGAPPQIVSINDPVAGANYILEPNTHIARKLPDLPGKAGAVAGAAIGKVMGKMLIMAGPGGAGPGGATGNVAISEGGIAVTGPNGAVTVGEPGGTGPGPVYAYRQMTTAGMQKSDPPQTESLGQQTIGGVTAQGTRTTQTIPAGQIGNELPIQVVSERWYSPDLMMVVMTKNSDPRFGTTVYQLNNVKRDAPAASLFEVPPDYTVQDGPGPGNFFQQRIVK